MDAQARKELMDAKMRSLANAIQDNDEQSRREDIEAQLRSISSAVHDIQERENEVQVQNTALVARINELHSQLKEELISQLNKSRDQLIVELLSRTYTKNHNLSQQRKKLQAHQVTLQQQLASTERAAGDNPSPNLPAASQPHDLPLKPCEDAAFPFTCTNPFASLPNLIGRFGSPTLKHRTSDEDPERPPSPDLSNTNRRQTSSPITVRVPASAARAISAKSPLKGSIFGDIASSPLSALSPPPFDRSTIPLSTSPLQDGTRSPALNCPTVRVVGELESRLLADEGLRRRLGRMMPLDRLQLTVIHDSSRGSSHRDFHRVVNGKGRILVLIKATSGNVFGGYVEDVFIGVNKWIVGNEVNFVFRLTGSPLKLLHNSKDPNGVWMGTSGSGFVMGYQGFTYDLLAFNPSRQCTPHSYTKAAPGYDSSEPLNSTTLAGASPWFPELIEVFQCDRLA
eukprot:m.287310 g.287310  ORF g.287310 m.287310 type:complete len:455 (-) comp55016_c0_seq4:128-1492(-)